jgi:hypothetical protein
VADLLLLVTVAPEVRTGYTRNKFYEWTDDDGDGCNTRKEVLIAQAVSPPSIGSGCALSGGRWVSPYDGKVIEDATQLDIDHVVPLAEAWDSGASAWSFNRRKAYANDLGVAFALIAVSEATDRSKGDQDPADWVPPRAAFLCEYLADWLGVKARWGLAVDPRERDAIRALTSCTATPVLVRAAE